MSQRVAIVGGGVVGLCCAWWCRERGLEVTVVERRPRDRDGCSFGNAGMIVPSHFVPLAAPGIVALGLKWMWRPDSPLYIRPRWSPPLWTWGYRFWRACTRRQVERAAPLLRDLHLASRAAYEELSTAWSNEFGLVQRGLLMLCHTEQGLEEEAHAAQQAQRLGVPAQVLDAAGAAALDPEVRMDVRGAVHYPRDAHLRPERLVAGLESRLQESGCRFQWESEVTGAVREGRRVTRLRTTGGEVEADQFVLAGGVWTSGLARELRLLLPMQAGKGYSLTLPSPRRRPSLCSILTEAQVAVTPMGDSLRFGGTMELSGLDETIDPVRVRGIVRAAVRYFPEFAEDDFAGISPWRGLRPCSPDGLPYLGRTARFENVLVATGHAMMGLSLAPVTGQIIARLITGEPPGFDLGLLSPDRYF